MNTIADKAWFTTEARPDPRDANSIKTSTSAVTMKTSPTVIGHIASGWQGYLANDIADSARPQHDNEVIGGDEVAETIKGQL